MKRPNVQFARKLRHDMTDAERALWQRLRGRRLLDAKFRRQHQIEGYIVDFVCIEARLVVELDGGQHVEQAAGDAARTARLQVLGYRVIRFWNDAVLNNVDDVLAEVVHALETSPHPGPLPGGERETSGARAERITRTGSVE